MKLREITKDDFVSELKAIAEDEKMLGAIGVGKMDVLSLCRNNETVCAELMLRFLMGMMKTPEIAKKAMTQPEMLGSFLLDDSAYMDLPVKFFLLGLRLGQKTKEAKGGE